MATTDTRSGFRLPWSSDRTRDEAPTDTQPAVDDPAANVVALDADLPDGSDGSDGSDLATADETWPEIDVNARLHQLGDETARPAPSTSPAHISEEPALMADTVAPATAPAAARKPSKLITDLAAAMRATAEVAREQSLSQVEADAKEVVEQIHTKSADGTVALRQRTDDDIAGIRDWSKAEIARIREETDRRISERKATLEAEIAAHATAIERRVEQVQRSVASYETEMAEFFERLLGESDPGRLAMMAESMPEPPSLVEWIDLPDSALPEVAPGATLETVEADGHEPGTDTVAAAEDLATAEVESALEADATGTPEADGDAGDVTNDAWAGTSWGGSDGGWDAPAVADGPAGTEATVEGGTSEGGDPVDRGSIMAALEAAAEAVVAAEAAAESADHAAESADVAETAAELIVGRVDSDDAELDPDTAFAARLDAGGFDDEPSLADRLANLMPGAGAGVDDATPTTTQVIVTGLVSVASIASFKRHLGRLHGVTAVSVASGPDGEFMFNVSHRADAPFRDAIPTLPGFGARVTGTGEGVVNVTARDPETEG